MNKTNNFQLNQWESTDKLSRADFNSDNAAIDAALAANAKALSDYQTANDAAVAAKAEQTAVTALETAVAGMGNCRMSYGTYTGTGTYGSGNPNKLAFSFKPYLVICRDTTTGWDGLFLMRGCSYGSGDSYKDVKVTWGTKSVSWYSEEDSFYQHNQKHIYAYLAFGMDE